ncbi:hypothetical protein F4820DRAFT_440440 [Hypoxylon rubiginosum]|uniref:Uncharacterized protein n=1 Tax=Hypoxylon rubiginosum TaxID=110542 RepID=A0ACB9YJD4_9PEZI|nr:hypothetical protein F4820DRAFT_440440 [Hypoxylon rubiginosum]
MATHDDPSHTLRPYEKVLRKIEFTPLPTGEELETLLRVINIYHPGYPNLPPLLSLHGSDGGGVHYSVAYYACCIIAGNVWDDDEGRNGDTNVPYLSTSRDGPPIAVPSDDILREKEYYFYVSKDQGDRYPVVPSFDYWVFPDKMPKPWRSLKASRDNETPDPSDEERYSPGGSAHMDSCRVTKSELAVDYARLVPLSARSWFDRNRMRGYATYISCPDAQNSTCNVNPLKADMHHMFDASSLVLVPKPNPQAPGEHAMTVHVLRRAYVSDLGILDMTIRYHNLVCEPLKDAPIEYHFARFAWSLFTDTVLQLFNEEHDVSFGLLLDRDFETPGVRPNASGRSAVDRSGGFPKPRPRIPPPGQIEAEGYDSHTMLNGETFCLCGAGEKEEL